MNNKAKGIFGETLAVKYLKKKGYEIMTRNFTTKIGEIDIVAADDNYLVFVEVKLRNNDQMGIPCEAVNKIKMKKISQTASQYINKYRLFDVNVRFDIIEIYEDSGKIEHLENAFESYFGYDY